MSTEGVGSTTRPHDTPTGDSSQISELTRDDSSGRQLECGVPQQVTPRWQRIALMAAGLQCFIWGVFIAAWPERSSHTYGFSDPPVELFLWQGMGLVIMLFGIGYLIASTNPLQHWAVILIGFLSKSLGPVGMAWSVNRGSVSRNVLYLIPINDLIWLVPFGLILIQVYKLQQPNSQRR
jgi:small multidrug resistance pump